MSEIQRAWTIRFGYVIAIALSLAGSALGWSIWVWAAYFSCLLALQTYWYGLTGGRGPLFSNRAKSRPHTWPRPKEDAQV